MNPLKIALFTYSTQARGGVVHAIELAEALQAIGHQVCLFTLDKTGQGFFRDVDCPTCFVPAAPPPPEIGALVKLRIREYVEFLSDYLRARPFDCYHAQDCISANALVALRDRSLTQNADTHLIPHVLRTVHHVDDFNSPYLQDCQQRSLLEVDRCFTVSQQWQDYLTTHYALSAYPVRNGVNLKRYSATPSGREDALKSRLGIERASPLFLTIGGIEPRKNSIRLLQAFAQVLERLPRAQLLIAGGETLFDYAPYRDEFFEWVKRLGIEVGRSLLLPGRIADEEMADLYRCADIFIFPSLKEGWGLVILEAIASGLPVVTSDRPPFTEFLDRNRAILVDAESVAAIAAGMLRAATDEAVRTDLVRQSQAVAQEYSWEQAAQLHVQQYRQFLSDISQRRQ